MPGGSKKGGGLETEQSTFYLKSGNNTSFKNMGSSPLEHEGGAMGYEAHRKEFGPNHIHKYDKDGNLVPSKSKGKWDMSNTILGGQVGRTAKKAIKEAKKKTEKRTKPFEEFLNEDVYKHLRKPMGSN